MKNLIKTLILLVIATLLNACGKTNKGSMEFQNNYKIFPAQNIAKGRVYFFHGLRGNMNYYESSHGQEIVQIMQTQGYEVIALDYPYTEAWFWLDGGEEYSQRFKNYLSSIIDQVETSNGTSNLNIIGGVSFGGLHAMMGFSMFSNKFDNWFGLLPVTDLGQLDEFKGMSAQYFSPFENESILASKPSMLLWGTADMRVNYNYTIELKNDLLNQGANVSTTEIIGLGHETTQPVIDAMSSFTQSL